MRLVSLAPVLAIAACAATQEPEQPTALDIAIPVGNGQTVFAVPNDASDPVDGGLFKISDPETTEGQNINAVPFKCFDPAQPDAATEALAYEFITSAQGGSNVRIPPELKAQSQEWYAETCHDFD
ncbi:MAG: hypothetical protein GW778_00260 [Alphaproteobacteria bacterium]|nr:hypothetical protein [Alphaproteobacteria bacterium]